MFYVLIKNKQASRGKAKQQQKQNKKKTNIKRLNPKRLGFFMIELIQDQYNFIQLLNNLLKVGSR